MGAASNSSAEWLCCRGCLATDVKLFDMHEHRLAAAFEYITGNPVLSEDGLPQQLCAICCSLLAKSAAFRDKCRRALCCLQLHEQSEITMDYIKSVDRLSNDLLFSLTVTPLEIIDIENTQSDIKQEHDPLDNSHAEPILQTDGQIIATSPAEVKNEFGTDIKNYLESFNYLSGLETDDDETTDNIPVVNVLAPTETEVTEPVEKGKEARKKTVNKVPRVRKRKLEGIVKVLGNKTDDDETTNNISVDKVQATTDTEVSEPVKKRKEARKKTENKVPRVRKRKRKGIEKPMFDVKEFEKAYNVDIKVLFTTAEQVADWKQFNASAKRPKAFRCEECGKGFGLEVTFKKHLLRHNPCAGPHVCAVCGVRFKSASRMRCHKKRHSLLYTCRDCGFVSRDRGQAKQHFNTHAGFKFACKHCDRSYYNPSSYFMHMRLVHAARVVACADCGESFISRRGLLQHQARTHKVQKVMSACRCAGCDAPFDSVEALHAHEAEDGGCRPDVWPCAACGESLSSQEALRKHAEERHEQQITCPDCAMVFSRSSSYLLHRRRAHGLHPQRRGRPPLRQQSDDATASRLCEFCGKRCPSAQCLIEHRRKHTGEKPFPCPDCGRRFSCESNMRRHQVTLHQGHRKLKKCEECGKMINTLSFSQHVRGVHLKMWPKRDRKKRTTKP